MTLGQDIILGASKPRAIALTSITLNRGTTPITLYILHLIYRRLNPQ